MEETAGPARFLPCHGKICHESRNDHPETLAARLGRRFALRVRERGRAIGAVLAIDAVFAVDGRAAAGQRAGRQSARPGRSGDGAARSATGECRSAGPGQGRAAGRAGPRQSRPAGDDRSRPCRARRGACHRSGSGLADRRAHRRLPPARRGKDRGPRYPLGNTRRAARLVGGPRALPAPPARAPDPVHREQPARTKRRCRRSCAGGRHARPSGRGRRRCDRHY